MFSPSQPRRANVHPQPLCQTTTVLPTSSHLSSPPVATHSFPWAEPTSLHKHNRLATDVSSPCCRSLRLPGSRSVSMQRDKKEEFKTNVCCWQTGCFGFLFGDKGSFPSFPPPCRELCGGVGVWRIWGGYVRSHMPIRREHWPWHRGPSRTCQRGEGSGAQPRLCFFKGPP